MSYLLRQMTTGQTDRIRYQDLPEPRPYTDAVLRRLVTNLEHDVARINNYLGREPEVVSLDAEDHLLLSDLKDYEPIMELGIFD